MRYLTTVSKFSLFIIGVFLCLQILYYLWFQRLTKNNTQEENNFLEIKNIFNMIVKDIKSVTLLDQSGDYLILPAITMSNRKDNEIDVTLTTQCSSNHLHNVYYLNKQWQGPMSVTVYSEETEVRKTIMLLTIWISCHYDIKNNIVFHLVMPSSFNSSSLAFLQQSENLDCTTLINFEDNYKNYARSKLYPNNLLRNIARKGVQTRFFLLIDIDMMPNYNLRNDFVKFIKNHKHNSNMVYVIPSFELKDNNVMPQNKSELLKSLDENVVRPFYIELCWKCQKYTEYYKWRELKSKGVKVGYEVEWKDPWEPFYIGDVQVPFHDERFRQYGFNRISQVCELQVAGYNFVVLDNAFLMHRGFKTVNTFHHNKDIEQETNRMLFREFKNDLKKKYPHSSKRCY